MISTSRVPMCWFRFFLASFAPFYVFGRNGAQGHATQQAEQVAMVERRQIAAEDWEHVYANSDLRHVMRSGPLMRIRFLNKTS